MRNGTAAKPAKISRRKDKGQQKEIPKLHETVALRAYQLFEDRERIDGQDLDDWLRAGQEVMSERMDTDLG